MKPAYTSAHPDDIVVPFPGHPGRGLIEASDCTNPIYYFDPSSPVIQAGASLKLELR